MPNNLSPDISSFETMIHSLIEAIGTALIHFVWQGALVAGCLALVLYLARQAQPQIRYALCVAAMLLMFALPVTTTLQFYYVQQGSVQHDAEIQDVAAAKPVDTIAAGESAFKGTQAAPPEAVRVEQAKGVVAMAARIMGFKELVVICWLFGLIFFSSRALSGFFALYRLRKNALLITDLQVDAIFEGLIGRMGIRRAVHLRVSEQILQPVLIGWLKPVILLPASIITRLTPAHLEAILAHELAHVRRHDYLVLLGQTMMETLFFFHPAVWWVSHRMRVEREYCCDEEAAVITGKSNYVAALTNVEKHRIRYALGIGNGSLLDRVRRLLGHQTPRRGRMAWSTLLALVLLCTTLVAACTTDEEPDPVEPEKFFVEMVQFASKGEFRQASLIATQAAEQGNLCAMAVMTELSKPEMRFQMADSLHAFAAALYSFDWFNINKIKANKWAGVFVDSLDQMAQRGDPDAALWLARVYDRTIDYIPLVNAPPESDSLAEYWYQEALRSGSNEALFTQSFRTKDPEEASRMIRQAAIQGYDAAFSRWAHRAQWKGDIEGYFEAAEMAVDREVPGLHDWLTADLEALKTQASDGDSLAIAWKAMADSLNLYERLEAVPVNAMREKYNINSWLCGKEYAHLVDASG